MESRFAFCGRAVVAPCAVVKDAVMIEIGAGERACRMTQVALGCCGNVGRRFPLSEGAVVTLTAPSSHLSMVDLGCRTKRRGVVARLANVRGGNVTRRLSGGVNAVMTATAAARNSPMVKTGGNKRIGVVAHFAR